MELRRFTVCQSCLSAILRPQKRTSRLLAQRSASTRTPRTQQSPPLQRRITTAPQKTHGQRTVLESLLIAARSTHTIPSQQLDALHSRIISLADSALKPEDGKIPDEQRILYVLEQLESLAQQLIQGQSHATIGGEDRPTKTQQTATSALLGSVNEARSYPAFITTASLLNLLSEKAEGVLRHPNVFITPSILSAYVKLQTLLHQPSSFPDIFHLYVNKPRPQQTATSQETTYQPTFPSAISSAVDKSTATTALTSALTSHSLNLAIDIIDTTFATPAFRRRKVLQIGLVPALGLGLAPFAAYSASTAFSHLSPALDPAAATPIALAGIMTYVLSISSMGYIAITTSNDQMDRVTWQPGMGLWERWTREEERASLDRIAAAWGFQEREKRGEEEGVEWEGLREECGRRGMVLDSAVLMDGME